MTDTNEGTASRERVALVTGGSRGIGRAVVEALAEDGWRVFFCSRSQDSVDEALEAFESYGSRVRGQAVDVRNQDEVDAYVARVEEEGGGLDCLVNNAGLGIFKPVDQLSGDEWSRVIDTNLTGAFYFLRAAAAAMKKRGSGYILNIASLAARNPFAGGAAYNASKFGLLGLSDAAMLDLRHDGVRVAAILPGSVDTDFGNPNARKDKSWMLTPGDIAQAVRDLLAYPGRALPSRIELRPSSPPQK